MNQPDNLPVIDPSWLVGHAAALAAAVTRTANTAAASCAGGARPKTIRPTLEAAARWD